MRRSLRWQRVLRGVMHGFVSQEASGYFSHYPVDPKESYRLAIPCVIDGLHKGAAVALLYGVAAFLLEPVLFPVLGASADTWAYCRPYVFWTVDIGAVPTVMNAELAHLIRAEGYSKPAGFGGRHAAFYQAFF